MKDELFLFFCFQRKFVLTLLAKNSTVAKKKSTVTRVTDKYLAL